MLHGSLTLVGISVAVGLAIVRVPGLGWDAAIAALMGFVLAVVFALSLPHALWQAIGDAANLGDPAWRALAVGMLVLGVVGAFVGGLIGIRAGGGGAIGGVCSAAWQWVCWPGRSPRSRSSRGPGRASA